MALCLAKSKNIYVSVIGRMLTSAGEIYFSHIVDRGCGKGPKYLTKFFFNQENKKHPLNPQALSFRIFR